MNKILDEITDLLAENKKIVVGIDGCSCAGKTKLADEIKQRFECNVFHTDDFFLTEEQRAEKKEKGFANFDVGRFRSQVLNNLEGDMAFDYDKYNCKTGLYTKIVVCEQKQLNVIEGTYCLCDELGAEYDLKIFLDIDRDLQRERLEQREQPESLKMFVEKWLPLEENYFEAQKPKEKADIVKRKSLGI